MFVMSVMPLYVYNITICLSVCLLEYFNDKILTHPLCRGYYVLSLKGRSWGNPVRGGLEVASSRGFPLLGGGTPKGTMVVDPLLSFYM